MNAEQTPILATHDAPRKLRVNLREHALSVPKNALSFSWNMQSTRPEEIQTGYRIVLAGRMADMAAEDYLIDTGWIATDESTNVSLPGAEALLQDNELYYWAVQTRDQEGGESPLSAPTFFSTAVGKEWAGTDFCWASPAAAGAASPDFAFLRGQFTLPDENRKPERVLLSATAVSPEPARQYVFRLYVNNHPVGMGPARLGRDAEGKEILYYNTYDVTDYLRTGENALGAVCYTAAGRGFLCQLTAYYEESEDKEILFSSVRDRAEMTALDGTPVFAPDGHSIGTDYYFAPAENIVSLLYPDGFTLPEFNCSAWLPVLPSGDRAENEMRQLFPYPGDPVLCQSRPISSLTRTETGSYLVDLGFEIIGNLRLTTDAVTSHVITLSYGEELDGAGHVRYQMRTGNVYRENWTLRAGYQSVEGFGMKTFRYAEIENCEEELTDSDLEAVLYAAAFDPDASGFVCSNETLCYLYDTFKYAIGVTNQDLYVDSQSRERRAYEGDTLINLLSSYTYEDRFALPRFSVEYLLRNRTWPAEYGLLTVHNVYLDYLYTGDNALLSRAYPQLRAIITALNPTGERELLPNPPVSGNTDTVMVDWPPASRDGYDMEHTCYNTVYNCFAYLALTDFAFLANVMHKEQDFGKANEWAQTLRRGMIRQLYDPATGEFRDGMDEEGNLSAHSAQHATAAALFAGVYEGREMPDAMGRALIRQMDIRTSIYFAYFVVSALYRAGFGDYATALLANSETAEGTHAWAAALNAGKVTIAPEAWYVSEKSNMTFSHPWGSAPAALLAQGMFGIRPTHSGFHKFVIEPQVGDIPYASITLPTVKGPIGVTVAQNREAYEMEVTIPANTRATVRIPTLPGGTGDLYVNGQHVNILPENNAFIMRVGSGTHRLLTK